MAIKWVNESEEECKVLMEDHSWFGKNVFEETVKHVFPKEGEIIEEWYGTARCISSDSRNVNMTDELNNLGIK